MTEPAGKRSELRALLGLKGLPGIGDVTVARLVERFGSATAALGVPHGKFAALAGEEAARARSAALEDHRIEEALERAEELGVEVVGLGTAGYPAALEALHDPPPILFLRGRSDILDRPAVAVVGSRRATAYGRRCAETLGAALARDGIVTVSGLAMGVDAAAHRGALAAGGKGLGVLGSGVDVPYPRRNRKLFLQLAREHLLISEFLPGTTAAPHHFPQRNRILAALSSVVVVVEAAARSGALITAHHALDVGRDVLAVPGKVDSPTSRGTHELIRDGAGIVWDPARIGEILATAVPTVFHEAVRSRRGGVGGGGSGSSGTTEQSGSQSVPGPTGLPEEATRVWWALEDGPRRVDELARRTELSPGRTLAALSRLETTGWAEPRSGMRYARRDPRHREIR